MKRKKFSYLQSRAEKLRGRTTREDENVSVFHDETFRPFNKFSSFSSCLLPENR